MPRVLLLGGALEYQRVANKLSSFDTLLEQVRVGSAGIINRLLCMLVGVMLVSGVFAHHGQLEHQSRMQQLQQEALT